MHAQRGIVCTIGNRKIKSQLINSDQVWSTEAPPVFVRPEGGAISAPRRVAFVSHVARGSDFQTSNRKPAACTGTGALSYLSLST